MALATMNDLLIAELKDLYSAETQLVKALPKMAKGATTPSLRTAFEEHLVQTQEQVARLEQIFEILGSSPRGVKCKGMEGLLEEASEMLDEDGEDTVRDAGIIASAQRVEHYEIAAYGSSLAFATLLGHSEIAELLEMTLNEEKQADELLSTIAEEEVNVAGPAMEGEEGGSEEEGAASPRRKSSGRKSK
ncbi:MAG TPA: ferritin-like domain-containing protein [Gemmatimonas sp.]|nr:ferritin-like domain-containing protein [Gemmatimonas sp.]